MRVYVPIADLQLTQDYMRFWTMEVFDNANLGPPCIAKHCFVFKRDKEPQWYFCQNYLKDSACIVCPCKFEKKGNVEFFVPSTEQTKATLMTIFKGYRRSGCKLQELGLATRNTGS